MRRLGRYSLLEKIASGSASELHLASAEPPADGERLVALEVITPRASREISQLLAKEADAALRFRHPAAARILEIGRDVGEAFIAMERVDGRPLSEVVETAGGSGRALPRELVLWIGAELASALRAAHQTPWAEDSKEGILHAGLSPSSVLISWTGQVKLVGLGVGRSRFVVTRSLTRLSYRAPEVIETNRIDTLSDIYSLGVLLYDALCGGRVFGGTSEGEIEAAVLAGKFERLRGRLDHVNELVAELIRQMMSKSPASRPQSAEYVERALRSQVRVPEEVILSRLVELLSRTRAEEGNTDATAAPRSAADSMDDTAPVLVIPPRPAAAERAGPPAHGAEVDYLSSADLLAEVLAAIESGDAGEYEDVLPMPAETTPSSGNTGRGTPSSGSAAIAGPSPGRPPMRQLARCELLAETGRAGASRLYRGRRPRTGEPVVLKVFDRKHADDPRLAPEEWSACFGREVAVARKLSFTGLPRMIEAGQEGSLQYIVYDRVDAVPLNVLIRRGKLLDPESVRRIGASVAQALAHLHELGFVYCNIQAKSVLMTRAGTARLVDLSMAAPIVGPMHPLLGANTFALSPEWLNGQVHRPASDQFALGALLYELLTHTRPFRGLDDRALLAGIGEKDPIPPHALDSRVSPFLSEVAMRALEKDPQRRFASCEAMGRLLAGS